MDVIAQYGVFFKRKSVHFNEILIYYRKTDVKTVYKVELSPGQHDIAKHRSANGQLCDFRFKYDE